MDRAYKKKFHYLYKIINRINDKFYVGMHSTNDLLDGYFGSGKRLKFSITKYGKENHQLEIMEFLPNRECLRERETEIINSEFLTNPMCMNIRIGGEGGWDHIHKSGAYKLGAKNSAKVYKERFKNDQEFSERIKKGSSDRLKQSWADGKFDHLDHATFKGKTHSDETIQRMKELKVGHGLGEKNSQFGSCWIHSSTAKQSKKINKQELEIWLTDGWVKGRKIYSTE
jgi:hypothetical protein